MFEFSDAESVEQSETLLLTFSERLTNLLVVGIHSLTLISPYALLFVTFGDLNNLVFSLSFCS